jgi:NTE family protein
VTNGGALRLVSGDARSAARAQALCHDRSVTVGIVLGGGGVRGAVQVGMLQALFEAGIRPQTVVGTSIGAINGAAVASDPTPGVVDKLVDAWASPAAAAVYGDSWPRQLRRLAKSRTHLYDPGPLRELIAGIVGAETTFDELRIPLAVAAACIETAAERWFDDGPVVDAVLASSSVPGVLPPTRIGDSHYVDGGIVNSIPLGEAVRRGATEIYVLQVGRIEEPLAAPTGPADVARISFEIARRHRFTREIGSVPDGVTVHVLPSGGRQPGDDKLSSYRRMDATRIRIEAAHAAAVAYLEGLAS